ncbi:Engulfment/cell motility [Syncephalis plumigaleata]|nr:Engulfment/cell motility [Syncephalis plumigaleata]
MDELNSRANTKYDSTVAAHERKLLELWDLLMPHEKLDARHSRQWQKIGFQGKDPATDFRSMGMLALDDLHYYAKHHSTSAHHVLRCSQESDRWYSFAIVGIHITSFAVQTLRTRRLQHHLYRYGISRAIYHEYYSYLFHSFNEYWMSRVPAPTIMDFERVFADFRLQIETELLERRPTLLDETTIATLPKDEVQ